VVSRAQGWKNLHYTRKPRWAEVRPVKCLISQVLGVLLHVMLDVYVLGVRLLARFSDFAYEGVANSWGNRRWSCRPHPVPDNR
jgi:hypothetical protein